MTVLQFYSFLPQPQQPPLPSLPPPPLPHFFLGHQYYQHHLPASYVYTTKYFNEPSSSVLLLYLIGTLSFNRYDTEVPWVVCRTLGYTFGVSNWTFGAGTGPVWLDSIDCSGEESSITECSHSDWGSDRPHFLDLGVVCDPNRFDDTYCLDQYQVRLVGGADNKTGRVDICYKYQWGKYTYYSISMKATVYFIIVGNDYKCQVFYK